MGRGDNRRSRKFVQKAGQAKKKARIKRRALAVKTARQNAPRKPATATTTTKKASAK